MIRFEGQLIGHPNYTDGELYRLIAAEAIQLGQAKNKREFDYCVRLTPMTIEQADEIIAKADVRSRDVAQD
jgi:hypothetical protein